MEKLNQCRIGAPNRCDHLADLADALRKRFPSCSGASDLDLAVAYYRQAAELCPISNVQHNVYVLRLGAMLLLRFDQLGNLKDLEEAIQFNRKYCPCCLTIIAIGRVHSTTSEVLSTSVSLAHIDESIHLYRETRTP
jgi:tetratricopeptide (TPR) repeat protein